MRGVLRHRLRPGGPEIEVHLIRTTRRKRTIALQCAPEGQITLRAPLDTSATKLHEILSAKATWLEQRVSALWREIPKPSPPREFVAGETFHVLGRQYRLKLTAAAGKDWIDLEGDYLHVACRKNAPMMREEIRARLRIWFVAQAKEFLPDRVARWVRKLPIRHSPRVLVSDQSHRWASCTKSGTLRFNWRLLGAPVSLVDYVIAHELCHLLHPNHSTAFWRQLTQIMPDRADRERKLSAFGAIARY